MIRLARPTHQRGTHTLCSRCLRWRRCRPPRYSTRTPLYFTPAAPSLLLPLSSFPLACSSRGLPSCFALAAAVLVLLLPVLHSASWTTHAEQTRAPFPTSAPALRSAHGRCWRRLQSACLLWLLRACLFGLRVVVWVSLLRRLPALPDSIRAQRKRRCPVCVCHSHVCRGGYLLCFRLLFAVLLFALLRGAVPYGRVL